MTKLEIEKILKEFQETADRIEKMPKESVKAEYKKTTK
jgi:hypothetical protein